MTNNDGYFIKINLDECYSMRRHNIAILKIEYNNTVYGFDNIQAVYAGDRFSENVDHYLVYARHPKDNFLDTLSFKPEDEIEVQVKDQSDTLEKLTRRYLFKKQELVEIENSREFLLWLQDLIDNVKVEKE